MSQNRRQIVSKGVAFAFAAWAGLGAIGAIDLVPSTAQCVAAGETRVEVQFTGGHETDKRDGGRPVVLIGNALGVTPEVFREAFSGVTPSKNGPPSGEQARKNKAALMKVLGPHGITNERLDEVSNYYRYQPQKGELWPTTAAEGYAVVAGGKITKVVITKAGAGYSSPPTATVKGFEQTPLKVTLKFGKDLKTNGGIASIEVGAGTGQK